MRFSIKIIGSAGQGVLSMGSMLTKSCKSANICVIGYRETPSLIKGGMATWQLDLSDRYIYSTQKKVNILLSMTKEGVLERMFELQKCGILIHTQKTINFSDEHNDFINKNDIKVEYIDSNLFFAEKGFSRIMVNTFLLGVICKLIGIPVDIVSDRVKSQFIKKPEVIDENLKVLSGGYDSAPEYDEYNQTHLQEKKLLTHDDLILDGTYSLSLGSIAAGARAYYAYPMSPVSGILSCLSGFSKKSGMVIKQVDDEITAAIMTIGSMHMGTRAFTATSGGGYDLMTESVSMTAITETPWVCVLGQRPGPATGLPTWTMQADLLLAIFSGHGEYPKCVLAPGDINDSFRIMGEAFNIAEKYQIPVIVLQDKLLLETFYQTGDLPLNGVDVDRGNLITSQSELDKLQSSDRFDFMATDGISKRWTPGNNAETFDANTDEHIGDGSTTEEIKESILSMDKRMKKLDLLRKNIKKPEIFGDKSGDILFVGWGSTKMVMHDVLDLKNDMEASFSYLHFEIIWPLNLDEVENIFKNFKKIVLVEGNKTGQLGKIIKQEADFYMKFNDKILKYDGRPFFLDDILNYLNSL